MSEDFEHLLLSLMNGLTAARPWQPFLYDLENYLGCQTCSLIFRSPGESGSGLIVSENLGDSNLADIFDTFRDSPFRDIPNDEIFILSRMMSREALEKKHPRHFDYHQREGVLDIIALNIADHDTGMAFCFRFRRSEGCRQFGADDVSALERLLPYLKAAAAIYARLLREQKKSYISDKTYSQLEIASITLKDDCEILSMNSFAESMIRNSGDFDAHEGRLRFASKKQDAEFRRGLSRLLADENPENSCSLQLSGGDLECEGWNLMMTKHEVPFEFKNDMQCVVSLMFRKSDDALQLSAEVIEKLFKLTPAEARLAKCLVEGDSLGEAADRLGRLERTARNQLSSIFAKTGVHKQHQLISHILQAASRHRL